MIKNISEYLEEVNGSPIMHTMHKSTTTPWFRGQANKEWKLIPSIFRHDSLIGYERDITRDFKLQCRTFLKENYPEDPFEWMYIMQHYGLPTRLLDWSESALIGLFFAVEKHWIKENAAIWILSPRAYNYLVLHDTNTVPTATSPYLNDYILKPDRGARPTRMVDAEYPLAMRPTKNSRRVLAQRGVFTIHGHRGICLNEAFKKDISVLDRVIVDGRYKLKILKELYQCGISHSVLFPELPGISEEILNRYTAFL